MESMWTHWVPVVMAIPNDIDASLEEGVNDSN